jgi:hypothetical protein
MKGNECILQLKSLVKEVERQNVIFANLIKCIGHKLNMDGYYLIKTVKDIYADNTKKQKEIDNGI